MCMYTCVYIFVYNYEYITCPVAPPHNCEHEAPAPVEPQDKLMASDVTVQDLSDTASTWSENGFNHCQLHFTYACNLCTRRKQAKTTLLPTQSNHEHMC